MASTLLLILVFVLDLLAFSLAVAAEQRRNKGSVVGDGGDMKYCVYGSDIATGLGASSIVLLTAGRLLVMIATRCLCCGKVLAPGRPRVWAIVLFISSWVTFIIAQVCLLAASVQNAYHTKYRTFLWLDPPSCEVLRKGVFASAAVFVLLTAFLSQLYSLSYTKALSSSPPSRKSNLPMSSYH